MGRLEGEGARGRLNARRFKTIPQKIRDIALQARLTTHKIYHSVLDVLVSEVVHNPIPQRSWLPRAGRPDDSLDCAKFWFGEQIVNWIGRGQSGQLCCIQVLYIQRSRVVNVCHKLFFLLHQWRDGDVENQPWDLVVLVGDVRREGVVGEAHVSVPARRQRHNDGQLAARGSNGGSRLAGEGQDERCRKPQDHRPAGSILTFLLRCNVLGGQIDWIELVALQVNDAVPELVNNTGLTLWAGSTVPIRWKFKIK